ncbi:MAG: Na/Pi cotransporter family protein [Candidatus Binatia bacterium]
MTVPESTAAHPFVVLLYFAGGLGLLPYGLRVVSDALQVLAGDQLRRRIGGASGGRRDQFATGLATGLITQSAAAAAVIIVSFVNAGLLTLPQAAGVLVGANLGATTGAWLFALRPGSLGVGLLGAGAIVHLLATAERTRFAGALAMGVGMLFVALQWLTTGWEAGGAGMLPAWVPQPAGAAARLAAVLAAALATAILRSATTFIGAVIALAAAGALTIDGALALVMGANLGSCVNVHRAAAPTIADGRRAALVHTLLNGVTVLVLLAGFPYCAAAIGLVPGAARDPGGALLASPAQVALAHTAFNLVLGALAWPLLTPIIRATQRLIGAGSRERAALHYPRQTVVESPALAIEECRLEVLSMAARTGEALRLTRELLDDLHTPRGELRRRILEREKTTDVVQHEVTIFMSRVMAGTLSVAQSDECRAVVRAAGELESIADYCERLANYRRRLVRRGATIDATALGELQAYFDRTIAFYEDIVDRIRRKESNWLSAIAAKGEYLAAEADGLRDANLQRLAAQRTSPTGGIFFNDILQAMRRIRNHALNLAEAFAEKAV